MIDIHKVIIISFCDIKGFNKWMTIWLIVICYFNWYSTNNALDFHGGPMIIPVNLCTTLLVDIYCLPDGPIYSDFQCNGAHIRY